MEKAANYNEIEKLFSLIPEDDLNDDLLKKYITSKLINGDYKSICRLDSQISEGKFKLENVFKLLRSILWNGFYTQMFSASK